jgi:hypothetical protein
MFYKLLIANNHSEYEIVIFFYWTFGLVNQDDSPDQINFYQTERKSYFFLIFHCWWLACSFLYLYKAFFIVIDFN